MHNRCLIIPGTFVPANEPMTLLVYKQLRLLPFDMDVCALRYWEEDRDVAEKLKNDPCYSKFHVCWTDQYKKVLFSAHNVFLPSCLKHIRNYIDSAVAMYHGQEYIYTSEFPVYTAQAGEKIKAMNPHVIWIANFTDPINHSPYKNDPRTYKEYSWPEKIAFDLYIKHYVIDDIEAMTIEKADLLLFICEEQRDFMIEQYLKYYHRISADAIMNKALIIPLNSIPEWNNLGELTTVPLHKDEFVLSHFGRIYGLRIIDEFLYAVRSFADRHPSYKLIIEQYGEFRKSDRKLIKKLGLSYMFKIHKKIPYQQCLQKMKEADAVLIFDTILPDTEIQPYLPSKIVEYSQLKKNTLAVTTTRSPVYRIMKKQDSIACRYDRNDILRGLEELCIKKRPSLIDYNYSNNVAVSPLLKRLEEFKNRV